jgi:hypothetical protein
MQPQLLTIIVIIVILYVIQHTSNRMIVKEKFTLTQANFPNVSITQDELDEVNKLCERGKNFYRMYRDYNGTGHEYVLNRAKKSC